MSDSQDQPLWESTNEQPVVTGDQAVEQSQTESEETVSKAEYKKLQAEYTKSRQELSETKKQSELSEEDKTAIEFLKKNNFLTKEDLEGYKSQKEQENRLQKIIADNPDLQPFATAISDLAKDKGLAPEDVIEKYGFKS
jgi:hypothetical protein